MAKSNDAGSAPAPDQPVSKPKPHRECIAVNGPYGVSYVYGGPTESERRRRAEKKK